MTNPRTSPSGPLLPATSDDVRNLSTVSGLTVTDALNTLATSSSAGIRLHDTTFNPVGLWQFQQDLTDSSGNGFDLDVENGTERYTNIGNGLYGFFFDYLTNLVRTAFTSALAITGDLTFEAILISPPVSTDYQGILGHSAIGASAAQNSLYEFGIQYPSLALEAFHENGAGNPNDAPINDGLSTGAIVHWAATRISNVYRQYVNGRQLGPASSVLNTPTGGSQGRLRVGSPIDNANFFVGTMVSLKAIAQGLSATEVLSEANYTVGPLYGIYSP